MRTHLFVNLGFASLLAIGCVRHFTPTLATPPTPRHDLGSFPTSWIRGLDCDTDPKFQVHAYNEDFYIIRQSKCESFEAPFMFLIFGDERALLMDTGANPNSPIADVVFEVVDDWLAARGQENINLLQTAPDAPGYRLVVAHTHGHGDHVLGDAQFKNHPRVEQLVGAAAGKALPFWGFEDYPNDQQRIDLGNRVIDVIGTPGHHPVSVTLYDRRTRLLLTGDIVYPGHLFIFSPLHWTDFIDSIQRLADFSRSNPVEAVVGCHIEMSGPPHFPYAWGTRVHPNEHTLQFFGTEILTKILDAAATMGGDPQCAIFDEFVIHPVYKCTIFWNG